MHRRSALTSIAGFCAIAAGSLLALAPLPAGAHDWPTKPIKLIVPFPPAGSTDVAGRVLGEAMSKTLGTNIVVDNRPGAAGTLGMGIVARAKADGYTLGVGGVGPTVTLELLGRKLPYKSEEDLAVIGHMGALPLVIVGRKSLEANNVADLVKQAKASPGKMSYGSSGIGSPGHLAFEYLKSLTGIDVVHVPYKGDSPLTADLMGGQLEVGLLTVAAAVAQAEGGKVKLLAVTSSERSAQLPEVPTVAESGVSGYEAEIWNILVAPAGTPADVVAKLNGELNKALADKDVREKLAGQGLVPVPMTAEEATRFVSAERAKWADVIKRSGAKLD